MQLTVSLSSTNRGCRCLTQLFFPAQAVDSSSLPIATDALTPIKIMIFHAGLGRIGFGVAQRLLPFGPKQILYHDMVELSFAKDINAIYCKRLEDMLPQIDFLCICCNLTPQTKHKINKKTLARLFVVLCNPKS